MMTTFTGIQRREKIMEYEAIIKDFMDKGIFILNPEMTEALNQITMLQFTCKHSLVDGVCEFCFADEEDIKKMEQIEDET